MPFNHSLHPTTDRPTDRIHIGRHPPLQAKEEAKDTDTYRTKPPASSLTSTINAHCVCTCSWVCGWMAGGAGGISFCRFIENFARKTFRNYAVSFRFFAKQWQAQGPFLSIHRHRHRGCIFAYVQKMFNRALPGISSFVGFFFSVLLLLLFRPLSPHIINAESRRLC